VNLVAATQGHFGHQFRHLRKHVLGLTQQQFAEAIGVDSKQPSRWESLAEPPKGWKAYHQLIARRWPEQAKQVPGARAKVTSQPTDRRRLAPSGRLEKFWPQSLKLEWEPVQTVRQVASWMGVREEDVWADPYRFAQSAARWMQGENDIHRRHLYYLASVEVEYFAQCQGLLFLGRCIDVKLLRPAIRSAYEASTGQFRFLTFAELMDALADLFPLSVSEELACCFICKEVAHVVVAEFGDLVANEAVAQNDSLRANEIWLFAKSQRRVRKLRRRLSVQLSKPGMNHHEALARSLNVLSEIPQGWRSMSVAGIAALPSILKSRQPRPTIFSQ
jgi:hypothetical protein